MGETGICEIPSEMIRSALRETVEKKLESKNCEIKISSASKGKSLCVIYKNSGSPLTFFISIRLKYWISSSFELYWNNKRQS